MQHHSARHTDLKALQQTILKLAAYWTDMHDALREDSLGWVQDYMQAYMGIVADRKLPKPLVTTIQQIFGPSGLRSHPDFWAVPQLTMIDAIIATEQDQAQLDILTRWRQVVVEDKAAAEKRMGQVEQQHQQAAKQPRPAAAGQPEGQQTGNED
eukprot:425644-Amphidinium_carterae.1